MDTSTWLLLREAKVGDSAHRLRPGTQTIGRSLSCDIRIEHPSVSRVHAIIVSGDGRLTIRDLSSRNGTFIDDNPVTLSAFGIGCKLRFGSILFDVVDEAEAAAFIAAFEDEPTDDPSESVESALLSPAEARVLRMLLRGCSEKEVAHHLFLSPHTVHNHIKEIYRAMKVRSRGELMAIYVAQGHAGRDH